MLAFVCLCQFNVDMCWFQFQSQCCPVPRFKDVLECVVNSSFHGKASCVSAVARVLFTITSHAWHLASPEVSGHISMHSFYLTRRKPKCRIWFRSDADCMMLHSRVVWRVRNPWNCSLNRQPYRESRNHVSMAIFGSAANCVEEVLNSATLKRIMWCFLVLLLSARCFMVLHASRPTEAEYLTCR